MLFGFSDQDAFNRVMSDARSHFRRVSTALTFKTAQATVAVPDELYPVVWLSHGGLKLNRLRYGGDEVVTPRTSVSGRRCLVPAVDDDGRTVLLAGVLSQSRYALEPEAFRLVRVEGACMPVALGNWDNWLNPGRDVRPMLWPSEELVVPGH